MEDITPLVQLLGTKAPQIALYWLAAEKVLKLLQPVIVSRLQGAIQRVVDTEDPEDERLMRQALTSKPYRVTAFALDFAIRVKLPSVADLEKGLAARAVKGQS